MSDEWQVIAGLGLGGRPKVSAWARRKKAVRSGDRVEINGFRGTGGWVRFLMGHYRMCGNWKSGLYTDGGACYFLFP
jgi:hypothetical protein